MDRDLVVVGNAGLEHVGAHLHSAAADLGVRSALCDTDQAFVGAKWQRKLDWWLRGHRPTQLRQFSETVLQACREVRPSWLITTGIAPVAASAVAEIGKMGVKRLNFLTDDPWNPAHRAPWFMEALPLYDHIFSPRRAALEDLRALGCPRIDYLPFAYNPAVHAARGTADHLASDVIFTGGADRDRLPYAAALIRAGFQVALYGQYWNRYEATAPYARGYADAHTLCQATCAAKVALCLVRRANRDGHVMRTFEVAATGACMLCEDTDEHREIFGAEGEAVVYFATLREMVEKLGWLMAHDRERIRLAEAAHRAITAGRNTYRDRLRSMLEWANVEDTRLRL